nr:PLDc N-terminal domain-containing protein [Enterococcus faecium]
MKQSKEWIWNLKKISRERKETAQTWAWLLVLMFIPVTGNVQAVMDGDLDLFIDGYLKMHLQ